MKWYEMTGISNNLWDALALQHKQPYMSNQYMLHLFLILFDSEEIVELRNVDKNVFTQN